MEASGRLDDFGGGGPLARASEREHQEDEPEDEDTMLQAGVRGRDRDDAVLVLMHFLGGSAREWDEVVGLLGEEYRTVAVDLPGFGSAAAEVGYSVGEMADAVEDLVGRLGLRRYVLVGHSMSGKVAAVMARRAVERGGESGLEGLVLVAPSPPGPEPMEEEKRERMLAMLGQERHGDEARAREYITKNEERDIPPAILERAAREVLRMNRAAWRAWLEAGSREDWAERVGVLELPAMVVAGELDRSLGPEQQRTATMPHLSQGELRVVQGCSHLVPMERAEEMAGLLREFVGRVRVTRRGRTIPEIPAEYRALMASERVSEKTREVLAQRIAGPEQTEVLTPLHMRTLRALCARIVPQEAGNQVDLAGTIAARLASGKGDGWRYAVLPEDLQAYREGLDRLHAQGFNTMGDAAQDEAVRGLAAVEGSVAARWFEEVRGDATVAYMAHPATYARIGYSGIGVGGATTREQGFVALSMGDREDWEPRAAGDVEERRL
jgi:pimeloyl-ACP methyl ester carboxylesterase